jgi:hypothetical protein
MMWGRYLWTVAVTPEPATSSVRWVNPVGSEVTCEYTPISHAEPMVSFR